MSMNVMIAAQRTVRFDTPVGVEGTETQSEFFGAWQTPTAVTFGILNSPDPAQVYMDWVMSTTSTVSTPVYADDDLWSEREPVSTEDSHPGEAHCAELAEWIDNVHSRGFDVKWTAG
jgi:hypothetical protein